jgi:hypothetical protein
VQAAQVPLQRTVDLDASGVEERVRHAAADHQHVDLLHEVAQQLELGRDLGAADHRRERPSGSSALPTPESFCISRPA